MESGYGSHCRLIIHLLQRVVAEGIVAWRKPVEATFLWWCPTSKDHAGTTWLSLFSLFSACILLRLLRISSFRSESSLPRLLPPFARQKHVAAFPAGAPRRPRRPVVTPATGHRPVRCARTLPAQVGGYERQLAQAALSEGWLWERPSPARRRRVGGLAGLRGM